MGLLVNDSKSKMAVNVVTASSDGKRESVKERTLKIKCGKLYFDKTEQYKTIPKN